MSCDHHTVETGRGVTQLSESIRVLRLTTFIYNKSLFRALRANILRVLIDILREVGEGNIKSIERGHCQTASLHIFPYASESGNYVVALTRIDGIVIVVIVVIVIRYCLCVCLQVSSTLYRGVISLGVWLHLA